jgi:uncharacterized membrane protein YeaQ/YmgE (transglycosylase-associated protein family)
MDFNTLFSLTLVIGAIAGWFATQLAHGAESGLLGIVGALVAVDLSPTCRRHHRRDSRRDPAASLFLIVRLIRQASA